MLYTRWISKLFRPPVLRALWRQPSEPAQSAVDCVDSAPQFRRSLAIRHIDAGSCNGCESEIALLATPAYDFSRYGFSFTPSPRHADLLLVTGIVTEAMVPLLRATYDAIPAPKLVVAAGACAIDGCVFRGAERVVGDLGKVLPVAARVPGCPPTPDDLLAALLAVSGRRPVRQAEAREVAG